MMNDTIPPPCRRDVFYKGKLVLVADTSPCRPAEFEEWVQRVAEASRQTVDWYYCGGRAVVKCLGDRDLVEASARVIPCPAGSIYWIRGD